MQTTKVTASEFQQAFGMLSDKARHEPVIITKHGRYSLVVMSVEEWERLKRLERASPNMQIKGSRPSARPRCRIARSEPSRLVQVIIGLAVKGSGRAD